MGAVFSFWSNVLNLKNLLFESNPSQKAKTMGLEQMPGVGLYGKDGKVTHRVVGNDLVPVQNAPDATKNPATSASKPTGMDAKTAGTKPNNVVTPDDVAKSQTKNTPEKGYPDLHAADEKEKEGGKEKGAEDQGPPVAAPNVFASKKPQVGKPVEKSVANKILDQKDWRSKEFIISAETHVCDSAELRNFMRAKEINQPEQQQMGKEVAFAQNAWRDSLDPIVQEELLHVQAKWQSRSQWKMSPTERAAQNALINSVAQGPPPATLTNVQQPIERGMTLKQDQAEQFLSSFRVGDNIDMPPSGFSSNSATARAFANGGSDGIGVVIRLAPNRKGELHGIALSGVKPKNQEVLRNVDAQGISTYGAESEIVRPAGPKARCTNITRLVSQEHDMSTGMVYVIDLEEQGYDQPLIESYDEWNGEPNDIFVNLMNSPLDTRIADIREAFKRVFKKLLSEGIASDKAHKLGLQHHGGPYWSKNGQVVAKTVNDTLVKVHPEEAEKVQAGQSTGISTEKSDWAQNHEWADYGHNQKYLPQPNFTSLEGDAQTILGDGMPLKSNHEMGGTNSGGIFKGTDGKLRYVKFYDDGNKSQCEALANSIYNDLGIGAPKSEYFPLASGKSAFASEMLPGETWTIAQVKANGNGIIPKKVAAEFLQGFAADCLVANWDALGIDNTNVRLGEGDKPIRVDNGGSFLHRATNGRKPEDLLDKMTEFDVFASPKNPTYSAMFQALGMSSAKQMPDSLKKQVAKILNLVHSVGGWENYVNERTPDMDEDDKQAVIRMLYERTRQLIEKVKENP